MILSNKAVDWQHCDESNCVQYLSAFETSLVSEVIWDSRAQLEDLSESIQVIRERWFTAIER